MKQAVKNRDGANVCVIGEMCGETFHRPCHGVIGMIALNPDALSGVLGRDGAAKIVAAKTYDPIMGRASEARCKGCSDRASGTANYVYMGRHTLTTSVSVDWMSLSSEISG